MFQSRPLVLAAFFLLTACNGDKDKRPPEVARNTDHVAYATDYPDRVEEVTRDLDAAKSRAGELCGSYSGYPDQIKDPTDYDRVTEVVDAADASGKSGDYAERARENREFQRMLDENDGEIAKGALATVHGAATQDGCPNPGNVAGAAKVGLTRAVEKRGDERLRDANEGHRVIKRNKGKIGKENVAPLEKQADEIAQASYLAHVELPQLEYELERLIEENEKVQKTLEREIEEEKKRQDEAGASDEDKKAAEERIKELEEAKAKVEEQKAQLDERKQQIEELKKEITKVQEDCDKALADYKDELAKRKSSAPAEAKAEK
jgi:hypothetical protein